MRGFRSASRGPSPGTLVSSWPTTVPVLASPPRPCEPWMLTSSAPSWLLPVHGESASVAVRRRLPVSSVRAGLVVPALVVEVGVVVGQLVSAEPVDRHARAGRPGVVASVGIGRRDDRAEAVAEAVDPAVAGGRGGLDERVVVLDLGRGRVARAGTEEQQPELVARAQTGRDDRRAGRHRQRFDHEHLRERVERTRVAARFGPAVQRADARAVVVGHAARRRAGRAAEAPRIDIRDRLRAVVVAARPRIVGRRGDAAQGAELIPDEDFVVPALVVEVGRSCRPAWRRPASRSARPCPLSTCCPERRSRPSRRARGSCRGTRGFDLWPTAAAFCTKSS